MSQDNQAAVESVDLSDGVIWCNFTIGGKQFFVELHEAIRFASKTLHNHRDDPEECIDCGAQFPASARDAPATKSGAACPDCQSDNIMFNEGWLEDIRSMLVEKHGLKRCSQYEAERFYTHIQEAWQDVKKNTPTELESPTGTESIQSQPTESEKVDVSA